MLRIDHENATFVNDEKKVVSIIARYCFNPYLCKVNKTITKKIKIMTKQQIINEIKGATSANVQMAFQHAEEKNGNFSYRFKKSVQYWTKKDWDVVAKEVKKHL